ncbi:MAG: sulfur carrier protein ThiS [Deltaproteobacteria bacterium]|nr:sulfur carrier protein ThiS [Deltaproteobacteria bacterium]
MDIQVNGERRRVPPACTVAQLVEQLGLAALGDGLAVCVNGQVIRRADWPAQTLAPGDPVEIVQAAQGG